jgi:hypothetical protein
MQSLQSTLPILRSLSRLHRVVAAAVLAAGVFLSGAAAAAEAAGGAGPSVGELLAVCERGLRQGERGTDAAGCEWFAVPCDCKATRADADAARWCMPPDEDIGRAMRRVVAELRREPDLSRQAQPAVARIMAGLYPCAADAR